MSIATKVIEARTQLGRFSNQWLAGGFKEFRAQSSAEILKGFDAVARLNVPALLAETALVWIASDMVDLIRHASRSLPIYPWSPKVLPWEGALCLSEKPLVNLPHTQRPQGQDHFLFQWGSGSLSAGPRCVIVLWAFDPPFHEFPVPAMVDVLREGETMHTSTVPVPETIAERDWSEVHRLVCTLWLLLQQKVAVRSVVAPDRGSRRRWERTESRPMPEITVIELRRPLHSSEPVGTRDVDWSHRWIVDGHWREQYHPSNDSHVPTWIAPYVKGPEEKPLVVKQRVHAWVR